MTIFTRTFCTLLLPLILLLLTTPLTGAVAQELDRTTSYTSVDGRLAVDFPADWLIYTDFPDVVILANNADALAAAISDAEFPADGAVIGLVTPRAGISSGSVLTGFRMQQELTGSGVLDFDTWWTDSAGPAILAGFPAERVETGSERTVGVLLSVNFDWAALLVTGDWGRDSDYANTVATILDTIRYTPHEEPLHYTTPDGTLSFTFAGDWHVSHGSGGVLVWQNPSGPGDAALWFPNQIWNSDLGAEQDALDIAQYLMEGHYVSGGGDTAGSVSQLAAAEIGEPHDIHINGVDGVQIDYAWPGGTGYVLALDFDGRVLAMIVTINEGSVDDYTDDLDMVIESLRFPVYDDTYDLATTRQLWLDSAFDAYRSTVHFRDANFVDRTHTVTVRDGMVIDHAVECILPPNRVCDPMMFDPYAYTVAGLFVQAASPRTKSIRLNVDYHYPERIGYGNPDVADSSRSWEVIDFAVLE
ncbi:hypothetical protein ACFLYO_05205 [Chloroflexota bacterium]